MTSKPLIRLVLSGVLIAGMGVATIGYTTPTIQAAPRKKVAKKKAATTVKLDNKTYSGKYYTTGEMDVQIYFMPGNVCSINMGDAVFQGTYKVSGKTVSITYRDGSDITMKFDIKNAGKQLYYEEAGPRHVFECELNLVQ